MLYKVTEGSAACLLYDLSFTLHPKNRRRSYVLLDELLLWPYPQGHCMKSLMRGHGAHVLSHYMEVLASSAKLKSYVGI